MGLREIESRDETVIEGAVTGSCWYSKSRGAAIQVIKRRRWRTSKTEYAAGLVRGRDGIVFVKPSAEL